MPVVQVPFVRAALLIAASAGLTPAFAQTPASPSSTPAVSLPADVSQVRDELERLRKEFDAVRRAYDERLLALEQRLSQIGGPMIQDPPPPPQPPPAPQTAAAGASKVFNPDTSVVGNFVAVGGKNPMNTSPPLQLTEAEVSFRAIVDPYARADFFLAAGPEGLEIEEGFITFTSLPANLLLKAGKMRAQFGAVNALHTHALPTVDRPLVTGNLVGGEEGLSDSGLSLSHLIPNPVMYLDAIGEVYAGTSDVFQSSTRSKLNYVARLRGYRDLTEDKNIDLGVSFATGPTDLTGTLPPPLDDDGLPDPLPPEALVDLQKSMIGFDATFRFRPLRRAIYQRLNLRTELIWSRQDLPEGARARAFGFYGLGEYQFARRWYIGGRVDRSGRVLDGDAIDNGGSVFLTFWPTEFSQIRTQFRHLRFAEGVRGNEFLMQVNFGIGAHGAHAF